MDFGKFLASVLEAKIEDKNWITKEVALNTEPSPSGCSRGLCSVPIVAKATHTRSTTGRTSTTGKYSPLLGIPLTLLHPSLSERQRFTQELCQSNDTYLVVAKSGGGGRTRSRCGRGTRGSTCQGHTGRSSSRGRHRTGSEVSDGGTRTMREDSPCLMPRTHAPLSWRSMRTRLVRMRKQSNMWD
jgi:hypothetical protein